MKPERDQPQRELQLVLRLRFRDSRTAQCAPLPCAGMNPDALRVDSRELPPIHLFSCHAAAFHVVHLVPEEESRRRAKRATAADTPKTRKWRSSRLRGGHHEAPLQPLEVPADAIRGLPKLALTRRSPPAQGRAPTGVAQRARRAIAPLRSGIAEATLRGREQAATTLVHPTFVQLTAPGPTASIEPRGYSTFPRMLIGRRRDPRLHQGLRVAPPTNRASHAPPRHVALTLFLPPRRRRRHARARGRAQMDQRPLGPDGMVAAQSSRLHLAFRVGAAGMRPWESGARLHLWDVARHVSVMITEGRGVHHVERDPWHSKTMASSAPHWSAATSACPQRRCVPRGRRSTRSGGKRAREDLKQCPTCGLRPMTLVGIALLSLDRLASRSLELPESGRRTSDPTGP